MRFEKLERMNDAIVLLQNGHNDHILLMLFELLFAFCNPFRRLVKYVVVYGE